MKQFLTFFCVLVLCLSVTALEDLKFLQLTDFHIDPFYLSNSPASQKCREDDVKTGDRSYFGRHGCDSPKMLLELMVEKIATEHSNPPFMILSGDMVTHQIQNHYNPSQVIYEAVSDVSGQIQKYFPNTVVLPGFGNNDAITHNQVPTLSEKDAFYSTFYQSFIGNNPATKAFLSEADLQSLQETFLKGGYYRVTLSDEVDFVMLNTNYWHKSAWRIIDEETCDAEIEWFEKIMESLPDNKQLIIGGHIFPGIYYQDQQFWNETYVERFRDAVYSKHQNIIAFFGGHTHYGDLRSVQNYNYGFFSNLFKDKGVLEPYLSITVAPAISPVYLNNPGYRSVELRVDASSKLYYHSYQDCFLNLTRVVDQRQYRFRKARNSFQFCYNSTEFLSDLKPKTIAEFNEAIYTNEQLLKNYAASKAGYDPQQVLADQIIQDAYADKEILAVPKNEWNDQFLCYSKYLLAKEVTDCVKNLS